jgi:hypothetical protein
VYGDRIRPLLEVPSAAVRTSLFPRFTSSAPEPVFSDRASLVSAVIASRSCRSSWTVWWLRSRGRSQAFALKLRGLLEHRFGLWTEVGIIAGVLLVWQALRIPAEGSTEVALAHARSWFSFEHDLRLAMEPSLIRFVHRVDVAEVVDWAYNNLHLAVLFAFVVGVRLLAPSYYPRVRTAYVLIHVPALIAIWAYPTAPPKWLPEIPFHQEIPTDNELTAGSDLFLNKTAALVSLHFGYSLFLSLVVIRLAPRSAWAWLSLAYPAFVLFLIIGSGNHFVLDAVTGAACVGFGLLVARLLHGRASQEPQAAPTREAVVLMIAAGLLAFAIDALVTGRAVHGAWYPARGPGRKAGWSSAVFSYASPPARSSSSTGRKSCSAGSAGRPRRHRPVLRIDRTAAGPPQRDRRRNRRGRRRRPIRPRPGDAARGSLTRGRDADGASHGYLARWVQDRRRRL